MWSRGLAIGAIGAIGGIETIGAIDAIETIGAIDAIETIGAIDAIETIGAIDAIETIGAIDAIETIGTIGAIETIGAMETIGAIDSLLPWPSLPGFVGSVAAGGYMIVEAVEGPPGGEGGSTGVILSAKVSNKNADSKSSPFIAVKIC